jgi:DNA replication protein DnaC
MGKAHKLLSSKPSNRSCSWYNGEKSRPTKAQIGRIADVLRGDFEYAASPSADVAHLEEAIKRFTEEQFEALDQMASNDRIIFQGAAGTGKTFLALEIARRALTDGRKVLFLCYNSLLGDWITKETSDFSKEGDSVFHRGTFHGLLIDVTGLEPGAEAGSRFWQKILPKQRSTGFYLKKQPKSIRSSRLDEARISAKNIWTLDLLQKVVSLEEMGCIR